MQGLSLTCTPPVCVCARAISRGCDRSALFCIAHRVCVRTSVCGCIGADASAFLPFSHLAITMTTSWLSLSCTQQIFPSLPPPTCHPPRPIPPFPVSPFCQISSLFTFISRLLGLPPFLRLYSSGFTLASACYSVESLLSSRFFQSNFYLFCASLQNLKWFSQLE